MLKTTSTGPAWSSYLPNRQTYLRGPVAQGQGTHAPPPQPLTATVWIAHQPSGIPSLQLSFAAQRPNRLSSHPGPGLRLRSRAVYDDLRGVNGDLKANPLPVEASRPTGSTRATCL